MTRGGSESLCIAFHIFEHSELPAISPLIEYGRSTHDVLGVLLAKVIGLSVEEGTVVLPLLATQLLWISLATDAAPALALGVDPPDDALMNRLPRAAGERVITRTMRRGIFFVAVVMAAGTLAVFDASLPGGLIEGAGTTAYAQTMAFTTLMVFQFFNVFNARPEERSAFEGLFTNVWLCPSALPPFYRSLLFTCPFCSRHFRAPV